MKKAGLLILVLFSLLYSNAQQRNFRTIVKEIEKVLFSSDTALFDEEKIMYARFYKNGNVELSTLNRLDTIRFNLHLLHNIKLDDDSTYNQYGLHLSESSVQLFLDPVMEEIGLNEDDELISMGSMLSFFSITLRSPAEARQLAQALINLRSLTKTDKQLFIRRN